MENSQNTNQPVEKSGFSRLISNLFKNRGYWSDNFNKYFPAIFALFAIFITICVISFEINRTGFGPSTNSGDLNTIYYLSLASLFFGTFVINYFGIFNFNFKKLDKPNSKYFKPIIVSIISILISSVIIAIDYTNNDSLNWNLLEAFLIFIFTIFAFTSSVLLQDKEKFEVAINKNYKNIDTINTRYYLHHFYSVILIGFITTLIFFAVTLIPTAITFLFGASIDSLIYFYLFSFCFVFLAPSLFILEYKSIENFYKEEFVNHFQKIPAIILKFILLPIVTIYSLILLAFSITTLSSFDFPDFSIIWLMISLIVPTLIVIFGSNFYFKNKKFLLFIRVLLAVNIINLITYFAAIYIAIDSYGFTANRYLVAIFGIFLALSVIYLLTNKAYKFRFSAILAIILTIIIFSPFIGLNEVVERSQEAILIDKLNSLGLVKDGKIIKRSSDISEIDRNVITSSLNEIESTTKFKNFVKSNLSSADYNEFKNFVKSNLSSADYNEFIKTGEKDRKEEENRYSRQNKNILTVKSQYTSNDFLNYLNIEPLNYYNYYNESNSVTQSYELEYYKDQFTTSSSASFVIDSESSRSYDIKVDQLEFEIQNDFNSVSIISNSEVNSGENRVVFFLDKINLLENFNYKDAINNTSDSKNNSNLDSNNKKTYKIQPKNQSSLIKKSTLGEYEITLELVSGTSFYNFNQGVSERSLNSPIYLITFTKI